MKNKTRSFLTSILILTFIFGASFVFDLNAKSKKYLRGLVVNINDAPERILTILPGVGPSKAKAIIAYRAQMQFYTPDELSRVKGIGTKTVDKLRLFLAVSGPSAVPARLKTAKKKRKSRNKKPRSKKQKDKAREKHPQKEIPKQRPARCGP